MVRHLRRPCAARFPACPRSHLGRTLRSLAFSAAAGVLALPLAGAQTSRAPARGSTLDLVIAATTDVHGRLRGWDYYANQPDAQRGLARVATVMDSVRAANPGRVVLVDAGDLLQGNPLTYAAAKVSPQPVHPVVATMNLLRYDAAVVGNHEFNYGVTFLDKAVRQARFPFLAGNAKNANGSAHFPSTTTVIRNGVRVAIIGATTPGSMVWDRDNLKAAGITVTDIVPFVAQAVKKARTNGADVVVVVLHSGLSGQSSYDTATTHVAAEDVAASVARDVNGIDLVVYGHSHSELVDSTINGAMLMQPKNWATTVGIATLSLQQSGGKWHVASHRGSSLRVAGHAESQAVLTATEAAHKAAMQWANAPVGQTTVAWRGDSSRVQDMPITDFVAEIMRRTTKADLAATSSFSLDAKLDSGAVTVAELSQMYPYDNTLRAVRITGQQLRAFLEQSSRYYRTLNADGSAPAGGIVDQSIPGYNFDMVVGADYTFDLRKPIGQRVVKLEVKGKPVVDGDSFTMAVNNYRQTGGGGYAMLAGAPVTFVKDVDIRQLMIDEVKRVGTIRPSDYFTSNWRIEPAAAITLAYAQQNRARVAEARGGGEAAARSAPAANAPGTNASSANASGVSSATANAPASGIPVVQPGTRVLRLLTTSDFHAALSGRADDAGRVRGGAVPLLQTLTRARAECTGTCTSITIDGGDLFSGSPASDWAAGKPTIAAYNRLGISAGALGNHEFDFGQDTLRMRLSELKYRVLAANVIGTDGKVPSWLRADTIVVRDGLRIGIVGAASPATPANTKRRNVAGLQFLNPAPVVSARIKALRSQNVDAVVVTIHDGARCTNGLSEGCSGSGIEFVRALTEKPDAVVLAHAHTNMVLEINGIPSVQVSSNGRGMGVIDIPLNPRGRATPSVRDVILDSLAATDAVLDTIVRNAIDRVRTRLEQPVANIKDPMPRRGEQYALGNLIADAMRVMGNSDFGAWNNGGIRADLRAGPLNYGGVHELAPFGNVIAKLSVRGKDLRTMLESFVAGRNPSSHVSGLQIVYDATRPAGSRIVTVTMTDGRAIDPNRAYTFAVNDFMIDDENFSRPNLVISTQLLPIDGAAAIADYIRRLPQPVAAPSEIRIREKGATP